MTSMTLDTTQMIWGVIFGAIGLGYLTYGKRQKAVMPLCTGLALCVFPYFVSKTSIMVLVGVLLTVLPYFIRF